MSEEWELVSAAKNEEDPDKSLKILEEALKKAQKSQDPLLIATCHLRMASIYKILKSHEKEKECLFKTEELARTMGSCPRTGALLSNLATELRKRGEYKKALKFLRKALPMFEDDPERGAILCNLGNCYYELNKYLKAIDCYNRARKIFEKMNHPGQLGICLQNIGNALREMNRFTESLNYYKEAYDIFSTYNRTIEAAHVLWNQAIVYDELEEFEKALSCYDEALSALEGRPLDTARIYNDKGLTLRKLTRYKEALHLLEEALSLCEQYNMPVEIIEIRRNIAGLKRNMSQYKKALQELLSAREKLIQLEKPDSVADVEWEIANVYASSGQPAAAAVYYDKVLAYYKRKKRNIFAAKVKRDKAAVVEDLGEYDVALSLYFEAEEVFKKNNMPAELASTLVNRGNLYRMLNQYEDALVMFEKAKTLYQQAGIQVHAVAAEFNRATVLYGLSRNEDALSAFSEVEKDFRNYNQPVSVAEALINQAVILGDLGHLEEALSKYETARELLRDDMVLHQLLLDLNKGALLAEASHYSKAIEILQSVTDRAAEMDFSTIHYKALWALGHIFKRKGQSRKAYHYLRKCLKIAEKIRGDISPNLLRMSFFYGIEDIYKEFVFLTNKMGLIHTAFSALQRMKARTLKEQLATPQKSAQYSKLPAKISVLYGKLHRISLTHHQIETTVQEINRLETAYAESKIKGELFKTRIEGKLYSHLKTIQGRCGTKEALIEYVIDENKVLLFYVGPDSFETTLKTEENLGGKIYEYLYKVRSQRPIKDLSHILYSTLIAPVEEHITEGFLLHIVPYKRLYLFPFHALYSKRFLAESCRIVYHPTSAMLTRKDISTRSILILGNPEKDLEGAEKECRSISSIFERSNKDSTLLLREKATKEVFFQMYPHYDIIHIACHGLYNSANPLRSGLRFNDGILTAFEMNQLDLAGKLVILGACGSGSVATGGGSEILGITRSLLLAGGVTITSTWEIPDTASVKFWEIFYNHLLNGESVSQALQNAQTFMISTQFNHPYFWAGYRIME